MKRNLLALCVTAAVAAPFLAPAASAQSFPYGSVNQSINLTNSAVTTTYVSNESVNIGGFTPSASLPAIVNQVGTVFWCVDIPDHLNGNAFSNAGSLSSSYTAPDSGITLGSNLNTLSNLTSLVYGGQAVVAASSGSTQSNLSAGLQIAIWALLYNSSTGSNWSANALSELVNPVVPFQVNVAASTTDLQNAALFLQCLTSTDSLCASLFSAPGTAGLTEVTQSGGQNLIILTNGGTVNNQTPIPEPSSLALLSAALLGLFGISRYRSRRVG